MFYSVKEIFTCSWDPWHFLFPLVRWWALLSTWQLDYVSHRQWSNLQTCLSVKLPSSAWVCFLLGVCSGERIWSFCPFSCYPASQIISFCPCLWGGRGKLWDSSFFFLVPYTRFFKLMFLGGSDVIEMDVLPLGHWNGTLKSSLTPAPPFLYAPSMNDPT